MLDKASKLEFKPQPERKAMINQMMGKAYLAQGKDLREKGYVCPVTMEIDKAGNNLQEAYKLLKALRRLGRTHFISILGDMSQWYEEKGDRLLARQLLRKQLRMAQKYLSFDDPK